MRSIHVWLLTAALLLLATFHERPWSHLSVFDWDPGGYYSYLPAVVLYQSPARLDTLDLIARQGARPEGLNKIGLVKLPGGVCLIKYPLGKALVDLPWFVGAHAFARLQSRHPADGFSRPYQHSIMLAGIAHALLGLWVLRKLLRRYFPDAVVAWVLLGIGLGTNLFCYASYKAAMAHATLFMLQAALLYCTARWYEVRQARFAWGVGLFLGLAGLVRPTELLWGLVPLLWGISSWADAQARPAWLVRHLHHWLPAGLLAAAFVSLQFVYWHYTSGHWVLDLYRGEGFNFSQPHVLDGLFSYRKGWLLYTPLMVLALLGIGPLRRTLPAAWLPTLVLLPVVLYVTFSWREWWYGGGFSARALISLYPLLALALAALFGWAAARARYWLWLLRTLTVAFVLLNLLQTWQFSKAILHWQDTTAAMYWGNFFVLDYDHLRVPPPAGAER